MGVVIPSPLDARKREFRKSWLDRGGSRVVFWVRGGERGSLRVTRCKERSL